MNQTNNKDEIRSLFHCKIKIKHIISHSKHKIPQLIVNGIAIREIFASIK